MQETLPQAPVLVARCKAHAPDPKSKYFHYWERGEITLKEYMIGRIMGE